ncbi:MAG TPA: hypothetical protein VMV69_15150 [Pirellulales bacterium]|nr:hypothetical protein [Pirellulales bacterium]
MPTEQDIRAYARSLPRIYQEILSAFPNIEPNRKAGYGLAFQTISADFEERGVGISLGEVIKACDQLAQHSLIEIKHKIFAHPTEYGEQVIEAITGGQTATCEVPVLPSPPS